MTGAELQVLVADLHTERFTLEDAERHGDEWVAYLFEHRPGVTYRVAEYQMYRRHYAYLPTDWITWVPRLERNGHDYGAMNAMITRPELEQILAHDRAGASVRLRAVHVRYDEDDDDRYLVRIVMPTDPPHELIFTTVDAYWQAQHQPAPPVPPDRAPGSPADADGRR